MLEKFAGSATLWLRFINYIKGAQNRFSVSKVRATYATAIKRTLAGVGGVVNSDSVTKAEQSALLIFRDLVEFERCCGYTERAISLWQALLELCLFCPPAPPGRLFATDANQSSLYSSLWQESPRRTLCARFGTPEHRDWEKKGTKGDCSTGDMFFQFLNVY